MVGFVDGFSDQDGQSVDNSAGYHSACNIGCWLWVNNNIPTADVYYLSMTPKVDVNDCVVPDVPV